MLESFFALVLLEKIFFAAIEIIVNEISIERIYRRWRLTAAKVRVGFSWKRMAIAPRKIIFDTLFAH